ncbi:MAG: hypothetical protein M1499_02570 [Firmicutes bacterium]|jgi:hypothetical protein|nr:hypothetical protein [Bacillota bacterium]
MKISSRSAVKTAQAMVKRLKPGSQLSIVNFKKDRSVRVVRDHDSGLLVVEDGFRHVSQKTDDMAVGHILKDALHYEFPRSHELGFSVSRVPD